MKAKSYFAGFTFACGLCLTVSCRDETKVASVVRSLNSNVVASVQDEVISQESYRQKLRDRIGQRGVALSLTQKEAVLEEMIRREAVYAQARAAKFDKQPEVTMLIKDLIVSRFIEQQMAGAESRLTSEQIQEYYTSHCSEFVTPAAARGAIIFLRASAKMTPEKRGELKQQANYILAEAQHTENETDFARLAQRHSEHQATRYRGGDLGWVTREQSEGTLGARVSAALFALKKPNDFSPLLETADGFYILKLRELKETQARPLAEVEELIRYQLSRRHRFQREEEFYARMKQGLDVQINRPLLESISIPLPEQNPPGPAWPTNSPKERDR